MKNIQKWSKSEPLGKLFFDVFFRSLEFLYDSLEKNNLSLPSYWDNVVNDDLLLQIHSYQLILNQWIAFLKIIL
jgi:hypothetical protein